MKKQILHPLVVVELTMEDNDVLKTLFVVMHMGGQMDLFSESQYQSPSSVENRILKGKRFRISIECLDVCDELEKYWWRGER